MQLLHVNRFLQPVLNLAHCRDTGGLVFSDFQNHETLLGADDVGHLVLLHPKRQVFELFGQLSAFESLAKVAALRGRSTIGILLGDFFKTCSSTNLLQQVFGFRLGGVNFLLIVPGLFGGNQNFAELYLLLAFQIVLM